MSIGVIEALETISVRLWDAQWSFPTSHAANFLAENGVEGTCVEAPSQPVLFSQFGKAQIQATQGLLTLLALGDVRADQESSPVFRRSRRASIHRAMGIGLFRADVSSQALCLPTR